MALKTKIEWTENTWNPVTGCTKISDGCLNCYAERMSVRLQKMGNAKYQNGFHVTLHPSCLGDPLKWSKPSLVFVNSMSDLFHEEVPEDYIVSVFNVMKKAKQHTFQILTKRADRLAEMASRLEWCSNIWQGVSIESSSYVSRIDYLRKVPSQIRFISFEPLIGDVGAVDMSDIHWAIVGGESGIHSRRMANDWVLNIKNQCESQNVLFYFKQWGGFNKKKTGRELLGQLWNEMPEINA